jgi:endoglucanase
MQRARGGTPTINISVPTRYLHNHNGIISRSDVDQAITLVMEVVQRLDGPVVQRLRSFS